jgi:hypothetical protein
MQAYLPNPLLSSNRPHPGRFAALEHEAPAAPPPVPQPLVLGHILPEAVTIRIYCQGLFLTRRDWRAGKAEVLLKRFFMRHPTIRLRAGGEEAAIRSAQKFNVEWRQNLVHNIAETIELWFERPWGLDWRADNLTNHYWTTEDSVVDWAVWFDLTQPAGSLDQVAHADMYRWCTKPYNIARIWRDTIDYLDPGEVDHWALHRNLLMPNAANPNNQVLPMRLLEGLRDVVRYMIKPIFEHLRQHLHRPKDRYTFGKGNDVYRYLHLLDRLTTCHVRELTDPANTRTALVPSNQRHDWMQNFNDEP